jgi:hypothetical protein
LASIHNMYKSKWVFSYSCEYILRGCELKSSVKRGKCVQPRIWKHATRNTTSVHLIIVIFGSIGQTYWSCQLPYMCCMCQNLKCLSIISFSIWRQDSTRIYICNMPIPNTLIKTAVLCCPPSDPKDKSIWSSPKCTKHESMITPLNLFLLRSSLSIPT